MPDGAILEDLCYHAQQAVEKSIKAVYIHAAGLTVFAVNARYPGIYEPVTDAQYKEALKLAAIAVDWAKKRIS